jgi:hypothetical protein
LLLRGQFNRSHCKARETFIPEGEAVSKDFRGNLARTARLETPAGQGDPTLSRPEE